MKATETDTTLPAPKRGRPAGQFDYHKLCVLRYLQKVHAETGMPFEGTNEELASAIGEWGDHWRVGVSARQVARYLRRLQEEKLQSGDWRIEISLFRYRTPSDGFATRRRIHVNDLKVIDIPHLDTPSS